MEDQYGMADLRQYLAAGNFYPPPPNLLSGFGVSSQPYSVFASGGNGAVPRTAGSASAGDLIEFKMDGGGGVIAAAAAGDGGTVRWPRQETLALLEIRSRMDSKFKEANQKGPLWEELSRIMFEEHGYQRSGKKCREKFENLYKYYKKTKEGKAGRQDGKHYRFFRQLEALYGESSNSSAQVSEANFAGLNQINFHNKNISFTDHNQECYLDPKLSDTSIISLSNSFNSDTMSSDYNDVNLGVDINDLKLKKRKGKRSSLKAKIRCHVDAQMREVMEKQEAWMEKMMKIVESKEQERIAREEQWRKQDAARIEREHRLWAKERNWIKARDVALMDAIQKLTGNQLRTTSLQDELTMAQAGGHIGSNVWAECEMNRLMSTGMEAKFDQGSSAGTYSCGNVEHTISLNDHQGNSPHNDGGVTAVNDGFFRYFLGDGQGRVI